MTPAEYWKETPTQRSARLTQQNKDRASCFNDHMELLYEADIDEVIAELLRLHRKVRNPHTVDLLRRAFPERIKVIEQYTG